MSRTGVVLGEFIAHDFSFQKTFFVRCRCNVLSRDYRAVAVNPDFFAVQTVAILSARSSWCAPTGSHDASYQRPGLCANTEGAQRLCGVAQFGAARSSNNVDRNA